MSELIDGLGPNGKLIVVGAAFDPIEVTPIQLINGSKSIQGWAAGTPADSEDTLRFAELSGVRPMIETYPLEKAAGALRFFAAFMAGAPRELSAFFAYLIVPPAPPFPEHLHMKTMCGMVYVYSGDVEKGERLTRPLREFGPPVFALGHPAPYPAVQSMFDGLLPHGLYHYWKADFVDNLTGQAIAGHVRYGPRIPTVHSAVHIYPLDGAVHDVAADQTAFAYRDVKFTHILAAVSPDPAPMPRYREWVRSYWSALHPYSAGGAYVNFLMDEGDDRIASSYRGNYVRLAAVKRKYDPGNLFRVNQNIRPAAM